MTSLIGSEHPGSKDIGDVASPCSDYLSSRRQLLNHLGGFLNRQSESDRLQRLNHLVNQKAAERSQRYLGRIEEVLVEDQNTKDPSQVMGRTRGNRLTFFPGNIEELRGQVVRVKVTVVRPFSLTGERV